MMIVRIFLAVAFLLLTTAGTVSAQCLTPKERLGKLLYFDDNLSKPRVQSCASCHHPKAGFADPDKNVPTSQGAIRSRFGGRNSPTSAYMGFSPDFHYDEEQGLYVGGQFWDGRAATLEEQAKGPFLNPLEMNNPDKAYVIKSIRASHYDHLFEKVFGDDALDDVEKAYDLVAEAIAAYERSGELNQFNSKFDYYLQGKAKLTKTEKKGLDLFNTKGKCAECHTSTVGPYADQPLFTDFTYDNLGVPKNPHNPFYLLPPELNPDGHNWVDYGLGGILGEESEMGKFKVPTLRNIAVTPPYAHNGYFKTLKDIVHFYNTRDVADWPLPEVPENVNTTELGDLGLTAKEEDAIVAFMKTLTDGYHLGKEAAETEEETVVSNSTLFQNSPNPFNPTTSIAFELAGQGFTTLKVYDLLGREVVTLVSGPLDAGNHVVTFDASRLASGVYVYRLESNGFTAVKKLVVAK
jgi:cytochrome c peroxidase